MSVTNPVVGEKLASAYVSAPSYCVVVTTTDTHVWLRRLNKRGKFCGKMITMTLAELALPTTGWRRVKESGA